MKALVKTSQPRATAIEDKNGQLLTDNTKVLSRWTKYCEGLYNYDIKTDPSILQTSSIQMTPEENPGILPEEVEAAIASLKTGKSPGADNVPAELVRHGGEAVVKAFTALCNRVWEEKK